jgi:GAF domain-containing protein
MPHLRCIGCGVVSYAAARGSGTCPECGAPWPQGAEEVIRCADPERRIEALVRMTRDLLDTDVALLTEISDGHETARFAAGDWPGFGSLYGASIPLQDSFCRLMLEGRIPNVIADASVDERVTDLAMARDFGVRAYMGVPIRPSEAELYVLCCLAREAQPSLGARELKLLSGLAESVRVELQAR